MGAASRGSAKKLKNLVKQTEFCQVYQLRVTNHQRRKQITSQFVDDPINKFVDELNRDQQIISRLVSENKRLKIELERDKMHPIFADNKFLQALINATLQKDPKKKYDENMKGAALYLYLLAGRMLYENLVLNLNLPSISTVLKYLHEEEPMVEGKFRLEELKEHISSNQLSLNVFLSCDATKITTSLKYSSKTNTILGLVLPLCQYTGHPIPNYFKFNTTQEVQKFIEAHAMAENANVIVAKSLNHNSVSFIVGLWGTDNKFKSESVIQQWRKLRIDLKRIGVNAVGNY